MQVSFFLAGEPDLARLAQLDVDRDFGEFVTGERAWILQTFLRLRRAGHAVVLTQLVPDEGIVVFSSKQRRELTRQARRAEARLLLGVREDVAAAAVADCEVLQNGRFADAVTRFFVPLWPQPGMLVRDPARGRNIHCVNYKGFIGNLHAQFRTDAWAARLAARGIEWRFDAVDYRGPQGGGHRISGPHSSGQQGSEQRLGAVPPTHWNAFHDVDLLLAVRPRAHDRYPRKPATKLYNAWLAGVPALLGPEYAYRELRRSDLDYIEISSAAEALQAIDRLRQDPGHYAAMVENGRVRAREFGTAAILARWVKLLFEVLPERMSHPTVRRRRRRPLWLKRGLGRLQRLTGRTDSR